MDELENLEQQLIQHLRTCGIRSAREVSLVDEVLDIRKARRQLFAALETAARSAQQAAAEQVSVAAAEKEKLAKQLAECADTQQRDLRALHDAWESRERDMRNDEELRLQRLKEDWGHRFDSLKARFSDENSALTDKLEMLSRERDAQEQRLTVTIEERLRSQLTDEFQTKFKQDMSV
jgi:hypothetical protein